MLTVLAAFAVFVAGVVVGALCARRPRPSDALREEALGIARRQLGDQLRELRESRHRMRERWAAAERRGWRMSKLLMRALEALGDAPVPFDDFGHPTTLQEAIEDELSLEANNAEDV